MKKVWYKITNKLGWTKYQSLERYIEDQKEFHYTPVKKIIRVTEEELSEDIIDDVNKQIGW